MPGSLWGGALAEFASAEEATAAAERLRALGYSRLDAFSPYPVRELNEALRIPRSRLPRAVFVLAMLGAGFAFWLQWYANAWDYPLNVGGRPLFSAPAWVPITFEIGILSASTAAFVGLLAMMGLPRLWHPVFEIPEWERTTRDRFWVGIDRRDPQWDAERSTADLERCDPLRVVRLEVER